MSQLGPLPIRKFVLWTHGDAADLLSGLGTDEGRVLGSQLCLEAYALDEVLRSIGIEAEGLGVYRPKHLPADHWWFFKGRWSGIVC